MRYTVIIIFSLLSAPSAYGQTFPTSGRVSPSSYQAVRDSVRSDSLRKDSLATLPLNKGKIEIVKRDINPRKYIILAVGMMVFLALILTTVQTWNPG